MNDWFTSNLKTIREKSFEVFETVRKDLNEFTTTIKTDTETYLHRIIDESTNDLNTNRTQSKSSLDTPVKNVIVVSTSIDRLNGKRFQMQNDESTYLSDPTPIENYKKWCEINEFNFDKHKDEIKQLLIDAPHVRLLYTHLVPSCTSQNEFWSRYFYRMYELEENEMKRINFLNRSDQNEHDDDWDEPEKDIFPSKISEIKQSTTINSTVSNSSDSWECEFDEKDAIITSKLTNPVLDDKFSTVESNAKPMSNALDDDWESWS